MVAVPILDKRGEVIGVAVLHTAAPREFEDDVLNFLVHTASLVAGAIENAQLYEETRRRVQELTTLTELSQAVAAVTSQEDLYAAVTRGARELLEVDACQLYRLDADVGRAGAGGLGSRRTPPPPSSRPGGTRLVLDLMRRANGRGRGGGARPRGRCGRTSTRTRCWWRRWWWATSTSGSSAASPTSGQFTDEDAELLGAVANQAAVGLKKAELIERLTAENTVKDMFDALASGSVEDAEAKARRGELRAEPAAPLPSGRARRADGPGLGRAARARSRRGCAASPGGCGSTPAPTGVRALVPCPGGAGGRSRRCEPPASRSAASRGWSSGSVRGRPRRCERPPADARGRRRRPDRPLAGRRGRRRLLRAAGRLPLPRAPGAGRRAARPLPLVGREADRVRPAPRGPAGRDARAVPGRPRQRHHQRPGAVRAPEHRPAAARSNRARRRPGPERGRTCSRWSSR